MSDIGVKLGVEGEAQFKKALGEVNTNLKTLGTEMKAVISAYDRGDTSTENLTAQNKVLNKQIDEQRAKLDLLKAKLAESANKYGENSAQTQKLKQDVNLATAALNKSELQLKNNVAALEDVGDESDEAGEKAKKSGDNAEKGGSGWEKFGGVLKGVGVAMGAVVVAAGAAAIKLGKEVVQQFGDLEQNLGGSEAVFQGYADHMQKIGEDAYKNMGVSQSQYLATANKMGALFQGSGLDVQRSAELSEKAMQRAADVASVMGIDMQMALDSVAGAAKGNFTMMDNLGVSMNATSIQAYAAAKGLDLVWASATQAEKSEVAMQMFFENTEQYAGNFARESTQTISGSLGLLQAALGSFTAGLGNANADMANLTRNLVDAFQAVVANIVPVLENIMVALPPAFDAILTAVGDLLPMLLETVTSLFTQVLETILNLLPELIPAAVDAVMTIVGAIIENLPLLIDAAVQLVATLVSGIGVALPQLIPAAVRAIITIVQGLISNLPMLISAARELIKGLVAGLIGAIPVLLKAVPKIVNSLYDALYGSIPMIIQAGIDLLVSVVDALPEIVMTIVEAIPEIINGILGALTEAIPQIIEAGIDLLISLVSALPKIIITIVDAIPKIIGGILGAITGNIDKIIEAGIKLFTSLIEKMPQIIVEIVKAIPLIIEGLVGALDDLGWMLVTAGGDLIRGLWKGINDMSQWIKNKLSGFCDGILKGIKGFFGIKSPSKVFAGLGEYMAEGLGEGFADQMHAVEREMQDAIPRTLNGPTATGDVGVAQVRGVAGAQTEYYERPTVQLIMNSRVVAECVMPDMSRALAGQKINLAIARGSI